MCNNMEKAIYDTEGRTIENPVMGSVRKVGTRRYIGTRDEFPIYLASPYTQE